jgi:hypothetical protein
MSFYENKINYYFLYFIDFIKKYIFKSIKYAIDGKGAENLGFSASAFSI